MSLGPKVDRQKEVAMHKTREKWPGKTKGSASSAAQGQSVLSVTEQVSGWDAESSGKGGKK